MTACSLADKARASSIRVTPQRALVCDVVDAADDHPTADEIYERARELDPTIAIATVYRTLKVLEDGELIARRDFGTRKGRYEAFSDEHHDHLIDQDSGEILEFYNEQLDALICKIAAEMGYKVAHHQVEVYAEKADQPPKIRKRRSAR